MDFLGDLPNKKSGSPYETYELTANYFSFTQQQQLVEAQEIQPKPEGLLHLVLTN